MSKFDRTVTTGQLATTIVGIIGLVIAIIGLFISINELFRDNSGLYLPIQATITAEARATLTALSEKTSTPSPTELAVIPPSTIEASKMYAEIYQLKSDYLRLQSENASSNRKVDDISTRLGGIEGVIYQSPVDALETTSLKFQLDEIDSRVQIVSNLYIGILGLIIAIGGTSIFGSLRRERKETEEVIRLNERVSLLTLQVEQLNQQSNRSQDANITNLKEQVQQLTAQIEKLPKQSNQRYSPPE